MKIEIKNRLNDSVIFEHEAENNTTKLTVLAALKNSIHLSDADLSYADLSYADLSYADLSDADLSGADLSYADLSYADLSDADMSRANLCGADMSGANLSDADMSRANLCGADMRRANLCGADMRRANLSYADLTPIRDDIFAVLSAAPAEVPALIEALKTGKVDGSSYEGECCCLVGAIAKARNCRYDALGDSLKPDASRPAERFFLGISKGDTPEDSQFSALALQWAEEWLCRMQSAFGQNK